MSIGIAITTRNRQETALITIYKIRHFAPENSKIVIIDDAGDLPFPDADFRFEKQAGIAVAKNKCLELLEGCDHIFLFDDDCYPKVKDWHLPYINSKYNHLMYIFGNFSNGRPNGNRKEKEIEDAVIYENPCGCMIYYKRISIDTVGGMDPSYGIWGYEHPDHSVRIYNAGLTPFKFMDVKGSDDLFFSYDKEQTIERSVPGKVRARHIAINKRKYDRLGKSSHYVPYKPLKNLILTSYFTNLIDPQRGVKWDNNPDDLNCLKESCSNFSCDLVILKEVKMETEFNNPYLCRWAGYYNYLKDHKQYDQIFMVDATDVEVMHNPFLSLDKNKIYVADEPITIGRCHWLYKHHPSFSDFYKANHRSQLLNAGVIGGHRDIVMKFLYAICDAIVLNDCGMTDMGVFNKVLRENFSGRIINGRKVNTVFKAFDKVNKAGSWFRHK